MVFEFTSPTRLVFGQGTFRRLGEEAALLGRRALLVTGTRSLAQTGHLDRAMELLSASGIESIVYGGVPPNPTVNTVDDGAALARRERCDLVVAIGGGSVMDAGKAMAVVATHDTTARQLLVAEGGRDKAVPTAATLPVLCVTSTAGTSSELTPFAVITVSDSHEKMALRSPHIQPRVSICDPELTYSVPPNVTAATGVDVLCHAMEAFVSTAAQPLTDLLALEAIRLVGRNLPRAVKAGQDRQAREQMLLANVYAGYALANCGATVMHAMEHPVSGHYPHIAHGAGLAALILPWVRRVGPRLPEKMTTLAAALGGSEAGLIHVSAAADAEDALADLLRSIGMDLRLRDLGVADDMLTQMATDTLRYMSLAVAKTPGGLTAADVLDLYEDAY